MSQLLVHFPHVNPSTSEMTRPSDLPGRDTNSINVLADWMELCVVADGETLSRDHVTTACRDAGLCTDAELDDPQRLGSPGSRHMGRTEETQEAASELGLETQNLEGNVESRDKDIGLDVAARHALVGSEAGSVVFLIQCATGKNWMEKGQVSVKRWEDLIQWNARPVPALAVLLVVGKGQGVQSAFFSTHGAHRGARSSSVEQGWTGRSSKP